MEGKVVKISLKSILAVLAIVIVVVATILTIGGKNVENSIQSNKNPEILRTMQYEQLTYDSGKIENCDYIEFSAFFTKDLNGDGKVEKILGSCNNINSSDELYMDINVMSKGTFKDGIITIEGKNFNYSMNMVKDNVLKNTYISKDVTQIQLKEMPAGTQKLIIGNILPDIQNNVNNYTGISKITFTGTYVAEDGVTETNISKTVDLTVDWYGGVTAELYEDFEATTYYYDYNNIDSTTLSMEFRIDDFTNELLLKENCASLVIPELSGYKATKVECKNDRVETQYDENTRVFTIKRSSSIVESTGEESEQVGKIINSIAHSNKYTIEITYPQEAFDAINAYTEIKIPIEGYYVAYNNPNSEFVNPYKSNIATGNITLVFRDTPSGDIYDFEVDFMEKTRVTRPDQQYVISKQYLIDMYNNVKEIKNKQYEVRWLVKRGIKGTVPSVVLREEDVESEETVYGDRWNKMVMDEYVSNIGIYFENADKMLGDNGKIFVYDNDTNELLKTFSKQDWNTYNKSNPYKYTNKIKHIRVETTNADVNTNLMIYNVKELDVEKVIKDFTKEEVENVENVYTYLKATCNIEGVGSETITDVDYANYISDKSYANIRITNDKMETQTVYDNTIKIEAFRSQVGDAYWKNAMYIVELPEEIINMVINNISISRSDIEIIAYDLYKKDNKYFIKIITENEYEVSYSINIDCKLTIDPRSPSTEKTINLYAYNDNCDEYYYGTQDIYDVDSENNIEEVVGTSKTKVQFLSPTSLITLETISNYNDKNEITVAPNVADIEKKRKKATVDIHLTNNYPNIVAGVKILGKIPFEGNTYILNSENLKSEFTATMTNEGVKIPEELKNKVVVYYSTVENPTRDILDTANGWTLLENVDDFSKIKTYLIDLKGIEVKVGENYTFNYDVNIPQGIEYNTEAFCNHAVFFELKTDNGNLELKTEPNKVGIRIARKYDIEITKYKQNTDLVVPSCIYKLIELDKQGNEVKTKIATTDSNGKIIVNDIYVEKTYKLVEMKTTKEYSLNPDEVVFKLVENSENNLEYVQISEKGFASEVRISKNNEGKDVLVSSVENKPKYKVVINKIDKDTKSAIKDAYFMLQEKARTYVTDDNGIITIEGLEQDIEYTLVETKANGYYLLGEIKFKLVTNEHGELVFDCDESIFSNVVIENTNKQHSIDINTVVENEKYSTCNIQILKVEENDEDITNNDELKLLQGAKFKLKSLDTEKEEYFTTDENGIINLSEIFVFEEKNNQITAEYLLQEVEAPVGYSNNAEQIKFRIIKNTEGNLEVDIMNASELNTFKSADVQDGLVRFIIEDKPLFNLIKVDEKTGEGLAGVEFVIYEINEDGSNLDFAKDANGKYVGNLNSDNLYVVVTGENGKVTLPLRNGKYKAIEVKTLEQYEELDRGYVFEVSAKLNKQEVVMDESSLNVERDTELGLEITCIEDLVDFSLNIKNGTKTYDGELVKLTRTLDFLDDSSYNDSQTTKYGDLNGDGSEQGLKDELTNKSGCGFTPIGISQGNSFEGTFDGQGFEIRNLYVKNNQYAGLFGFTVQAVVENIGVTGDVYGQNYTAGIVAKDIYTSILNSYSKVNIHLEENSSTQYVGGIVGEQYYNSIVYNCYNEGEIVVSDKKINAYIGGIVGTSSSAKIINSYNKGKIELSGYLDIQLGGILGKSSSEVINCHNYSDIRINRKDGGNGTYYIGGIVGNGGKITKSSNNGKIFNDLDRQYSYLYIGGIAGMSNEVTKSYNKGELHLNTTDNCDSYISGITYSYGSAVIIDCYNSADIYNFQEGENMCNANVNGIGRGNINRCYNTGDIYNTADCNSYVTVYVNGIGYSCTIKNSYNTGDILNIATSNGAGINTYVAGVGVYGTISNCYNVGSLINTARAINTTSSASVRNGFISYGGTVNNCYYLDTVSISEGDNNTSGTKVTKEQLQSKEIYNQLNAEGVWLYYLDNMPKLDMIEQANIVGSFDLQIANTKKSFKITTDVLEVDGEKGGTITGDDTLTFEVVEYGSENSKEIKITKYKDYEIDEILVNGESIEFELDENGEYVIPAGYFKNIQEDIHIVAKFIPLDNLIIRKVDADDNSIGLEGVKFRLEEKVKITPNKLIGEIQTGSGGYTFVKKGSAYESTNTNGATCSRAYFPIDLSNYSGKTFNLSVSYSCSGQPTAYCLISRSSVIPYVYNNSSDFFVNVSGNVSSSASISLEGGHVYYLHIGYYRGYFTPTNSSDKFIVKSINLSCSDDLGYGYMPVSEYITNSNGIVSTRVRNNTEYRLVEIESIYGYEKNEEKHEFTVNEHEIKDLVIENKNIGYNYTILKQNKETKEPVKGVKFDIYAVRQKNKALIYTGVTDENGELKLSLEPGYYRAVEIDAPNGYIMDSNQDLRTTYFKVGEIKNDFEVNYIEDLIDFSNDVNSGNNYQYNIVALKRTLDFNDNSCYKNSSNTTTYGDYNGDGVVQTIKEELTNTTGRGFTPIGVKNSFNGIFDGNGYEIKNIYINNGTYKFSGLFGEIHTAMICNLGITGQINSTYSGTVYHGGIIGAGLNSLILNCNNKANIIVKNSSSAYVGGILGSGGMHVGGDSMPPNANQCSGNTIINCYNNGNIDVSASSKNVGGISGYQNTSVIINCYNTGNIEMNSNGFAGGISGRTFYENSAINCYNTGNISNGTKIGGIMGELNYGTSIVENCYNIGLLESNVVNSNIVGIAIHGSSSSTSVITNSYWLNIASSNGVYNGEDNTISMTEQQMKSQTFTDLLNDGNTMANFIQGDTEYPVIDYEGLTNVQIIETSKIKVNNSPDKNKYLKTIKKLNKKTNEPIPNVKFEIYDIKDTSGLAIYTDVTDENGEINALLNSGYYKAIEVEVPDGYVFEEDKDLRTTYFKVGDIKADFEINYIEDLVDFSNNVNNGNYYQNKVVVLNKNLDFNDSSCYKDAADTTTYGDYNGDGAVQTIKEELTNTSSSGFRPIGRSYSFQGIFDGNGYEIQNIHINNTNSYSYTGLFAYSYNAVICNLGITGTIKTTYPGYYNIGGILGDCNNMLIINCYNKATVIGNNSSSSNSSNGFCAGITGYSYNNKIINCYNEGNISGTTYGGISYVGGIVGASYSDKILNCYNEGNVNSYSINSWLTVGGIVGNANNNNDKIINCYNKGNIYASANGSKYIGGIAGRLYDYTYSIINRCYNIGNISTDTSRGYDYKGSITGYFAINATESYWLNTTADNGVYGTLNYTQSLTEEEMKSQEFIKILNNDNSVTYENGVDGYPIISNSNYNAINSDFVVYNTPKEVIYKVNTKIIKDEYQTEEGGSISGNGMYAYEVIDKNENSIKDIIIKPDDGWKISYVKVNGEKIEFNENEDGTVLLDKFENVIEDKEIAVKFELIIKPNYILKKVDKETNEPIQGVEFDVKTIYGKDYSDNIDNKIFVTNEDGEVNLELEPGYYKAIEKKVPEGYILEADEELRTTYFKVGDIKADFEINYIEDLVDFSNNVNNGNYYQNKIVVLNKNLDFNNSSCYKDATDTTTYGDYNGDGVVQTIKEELTNTSSSGFRPIGRSYSFQGIFDGNCYEIQNIHINNTNGYSYTGVFANSYNAVICNLGITGTIKTTYPGYYSIGGILGYSSNNIIINCYNKATVIGNNSSSSNSNNGYCAGIIGYSSNNKIINCYNEGNISGTTFESLLQTGGIVGYGSNDKIISCYNNGNINAYSTNSWVTVGGIAGYIYNYEKIINCYNKGTIYASASGSKYIGGIVGNTYNPSYSIINKCYNVGTINTDKSRGYDYSGSIAGNYSNYNVTEAYWLNTTETKGVNGTPNYTQVLTEQEMKSEEFIKILNNKNSLTYIKGTDDYPVIGHNNNYINENVSIGSEMLIKNASMTEIYKIYTNVIKDIYQTEEGGNISGKGMYAYEVIDKNENSIKDIIIKPDDGWKISYIKVNGEKIEFNENEDGTVLLDKFENVTEDKEITVKFELKVKPNYILKKVDKETNEPIQGVEFDVKTIYGDDCSENIDDMYFIEAEKTNIVSGNPNWSSSSYSNGYGVDYAYDLSFEFNVENKSKYRFYLAGSWFNERTFNLEIDGKLFETYNSLVNTTDYRKTYIDLGFLEEGKHKIRLTTNNGNAPIYDYFEVCPYTTFVTNENGEINLELENGYYTALEKNIPEGYIFEEDEDLRTTYFRIGDIKADFEINYIEDLVDFSNNVNNGNYYKNKIVELNRNLDFNNSSCYRNATDTTTYGDYNGDGVVQTIKEELTNISSTGFRPIGRSYSFQGIFDGNGYEIQNIHINNTNSYSYTGLFAYSYNAVICNLGITGTIKTTYPGYYNIGGILGYSSNNLIINCYNKATVIGNNSSSSNSNNGYCAGIIGYSSNNKIINCYNEGNISGTTFESLLQTGGIVGYGSNDKIISCYNNGNINAYSTNSWVTVGGIAGYIYNYEKIINCYNKGTIYASASGSKYIGGIVGNTYNPSYSIINKCYNVGTINTDKSRGYDYSGSIAGNYSNYNVTEAYWLNTTETKGVNGTPNYTQVLTEQEMKSEEFIKLLNNKNVVTYIRGTEDYPVIEHSNNYMDENISIGSEILIKNAPQTEIYNISTKVVRNSTQTEDGGTISGNGLYAYEVINENGNSIKNILIEPNTGWEIGIIKINDEVIDFTADFEGKVLLDKFENVNENKKIEVQFIPIVQNIFTLTKIDEQTNEPLQGIKFAIYNITAVQDFAKDKNNIYIGLKDKNGLYVVTTDENGQIKLDLPGGKYKAVEIEGPENYYLSEDEEERTTYFSIIEQGNIEINYIEDLVDLSNNVLNGNNYEGKTVILKRTLDFNDVKSYRDANDKTTYGDYNGDGVVQTIKEELTNTSGSGFKPIGTSTLNSFKGTFNGCGYEINNFYNNYGTMCLFNYVSGKIINLGTSGDITITRGYALIQRIDNSEIENCYSKTNITMENWYTSAGLIYNSYNSKIVNCYNNGKFYAKNGASIAGITAYNYGTEITNCYNSGDYLSETGATIGGIALSIYDKSIIDNCYNSGNISANGENNSITVGGIVQYCNNGSSILNCCNKGNISTKGDLYGAGIVESIYNGEINNCYNEGEITVGDYASLGGIVRYSGTTKITNCYNTKDITVNNIMGSTSYVGGIAYTLSSNSEVYNCYNIGNIVCTAGQVAGLSQYLSDSKIANCYNLGNVISNNGKIAGIVQNYYGSLIENCYNAGDLQSLGETGGIIQYYSSGTSTNNYYLNSSAMQGIYGQVDQPGVVEAKSKNYMKSQEFVELLNNNKNNIETSEKLSNWVYKEGEYPTLDLGYKLKGVTISEYINPMEFETVDSAITITNSKKSEVIIHHYLEGTGAEYNSEPVKLLEDEVVVGRINHPYTSVPKLEIEGYVLSTDENGEYIIPENASGTFAEETQHIYYYYNVKRYELTVQYYIEGTEEKITEDSKYHLKENEHYKIEPSEDVLLMYELVSVIGDEEKDITQNEVVTYYLKKKIAKITTKVEIPENELENGRTEKGGTILGEEEEVYESIPYGENSTKEISAMPDASYRLNSITVNGEQVPYTIENGKIYISKFENIIGDKEVVVKFEPIIGKVITHHYIQGTSEKLYEDIIVEEKIGEIVQTNPVAIDNYKLVGSEGNKDENGNVVITKEISEGIEEIIYYYQRSYIITTDVIEHNETYKDGTIKEKVKGGSITNEDVVIHEQVMKYDSNTKTIEMKPDEGYEISEIKVNGSIITSELQVNDDGTVVIKEGYFTNIQSDIHVEVEYRKKTKVIVKYLDKETESEIISNTEILGYEGKEFETTTKTIVGYKIVKIPVSENSSETIVKVTDENNELTETKGTMISEDIIIAYWYEKIDAYVIERHIEINEKGEEIEIDCILYNDDTVNSVKTERKTYDKYISADAPEEVKENINNNYTNVKIIGKDENSYTASVDLVNTNEVWYYYIKQYNITTEVKPHKEVIDGNEVEVNGGTISKEYELDADGKEVEIVYEVVNSRGNSKKEIKMIPDNYYRIKSVMVNDNQIYIDNMIAEDGSLTIPAEYFKDVQKDYHIVVEYEKIPAKVIVKYIDEYTKESILPDKIIDGFVNDEYNEARVEIDSYIPAEPEPENTKGRMTKDNIVITYYYCKQYKITTDVIEHLEDEEKGIVDVVVEKLKAEVDALNNDNKVISDIKEDAENKEDKANALKNDNKVINNTKEDTQNKETKEEISKLSDIEAQGGTVRIIPKGKKLVKGGTIQGEDEEPYETVSRGKDNTKEILIKPDDGYRIKSFIIKDGENEYNLSVKDYLTKDKTIIIPVSYFKNMQADKHVMVEFEQIPAKVIVNYLDIATKDSENPNKVSISESGEGFVNDDYKTYEKNIPYYELVEGQLPENKEGKLTQEDTIVNYWYRKLLFNMKVTKEFSSIQMNGIEMLGDNKKFVKLDIVNTDLNLTSILVKYKVSVTNTHEIEGTARIVENIPVGLIYEDTNATEDKVQDVWKQVDGKLELITRTLKPGETAEYELVFKWDENLRCIGQLVSVVNIKETNNLPKFEETTLLDNQDMCTMLLVIRTGENRNIKMIISMCCFALAGVCTMIYIGTEIHYRKKKE